MQHVSAHAQECIIGLTKLKRKSYVYKGNRVILLNDCGSINVMVMPNDA
jgi:hypothetical protein